MTDIVERLRAHPGPALTVTEQFRIMVEQRHEAAAEIERLKAIEAAAKAVIDVMDRATSTAQARRLSIINLRNALEPKP